MEAWSAIAIGLCIAALAIHLTSVALASLRCRKNLVRPSLVATPPVTILRPVCGLDNFLEETLASGLSLNYPHYETIFCVANPRDPALPLLHALAQRFPHARQRVLVGDDRISENPKLNNLVKGWHATEHDWLVMADSNVLMPPDYLQRLLGSWREDTGLVCSPPSGSHPQDLGAALECAFLNGYQARWQYAADSCGLGFAQGKTMLWRRRDLAAAGGIAALASETAEDAAATKIVRNAGLRVRLVDAPFPQPLGRRGFGEVWRRQARWAQLRRASFPVFYAAELAGTPWLPVGMAAAGSGFFAALLALVLWYAAELVLNKIAGWPLSWRTPFAMIARDLMLPALWCAGWYRAGFVWRGNEMQARPAGA